MQSRLNRENNIGELLCVIVQTFVIVVNTARSVANGSCRKAVLMMTVNALSAEPKSLID